MQRPAKIKIYTSTVLLVQELFDVGQGLCWFLED